MVKPERDITDINQDVLDGVGELVNILSGGLKTRFSNFAQKMELSIPTIIQGKGEMFISKIRSTENISIKVECEGIGGNFLVQPSTLKACRKRWSPMVSDWLPIEQSSCEDWTTAFQKASGQYKSVIAAAPDSILDPAIDRDLVNYIENLK